MIEINGILTDEERETLRNWGTVPRARRHANLVICGGLPPKKKNLFYRTYEKTETANGVTFFWDAAKQEFELNGTTIAYGDLKLVVPMYIDWKAGEKYTVSVYHVSGEATLGSGSGTSYSWSIFSNDLKKYIRSGNLASTTFPEVFSFTGTAFEAASYIFYFQCWRNGTTFKNYRVRVQIEKGEKSTAWEAYRVEG